MIRRSEYRVEVLRGGALRGALRCAEPYRVDCSADAAITRSLSVRAAYDPDYQPLTDALRPVLRLDGVDYPLGIYHAASCRDVYDDTGAHLVEIEAYDSAWLLSRARTEEVLHLAAGTPYTTAVDRLLAAADLPLRYLTPSAAVLATDREDWEIGTSYLDIINRLLSEINYAPIWYNADGWAVIAPLTEPSAANVQHSYGGAGAGFRLVKTAARSEVDAWDVPNVFIVICDNPDYDAPMIATAVNDNPLSALSVHRLGRRVPTVVKVDNIASQAALERYAAALRDESILRGQVAEIETPAMPGHGVGDVVALTHPDVGGIWRETGWSLTAGPGGGMRHTLQRMILV